MKRKKTSPLSIDLSLQRIKDEGIVVFDNVYGLPTDDQPFFSPDYVICICHKGNTELLYDDYYDCFEKYNVSVIFPNHSIKKISKTDDYMATLIVVNAAMLNDPMLNIINQMRYRYEPYPCVKLDKHEYGEIMNVVELMRETVLINLSDRRILLSRQLEFLLRLLGCYRKNKLNETSPDKHVSMQFHFDLQKHVHQHRDVEFYANLACLSPKYFSAVIKQETGYNAVYWIRKHIIADAKMLLHIRHDLSIQAVSDMLGFDEQTTFSRYFKRDTGMSPTEFRRNK